MIYLHQPDALSLFFCPCQCSILHPEGTCHTYADSRRMHFEEPMKKQVYCPLIFFLSFGFFFYLWDDVIWMFKNMFSISGSSSRSVSFFFVRKNHEFQIHLDHLTSFFCADVSVCCCFGFILKRRQQVHHHTRPLYCIFHCCLNAQRFLPACLYVRTYEIRSFEPGLTHTHTHAQEREISRWPLASTACCACVYAEHVTSAYKNSWRRLD